MDVHWKIGCIKCNASLGNVMHQAAITTMLGCVGSPQRTGFQYRPRVEHRCQDSSEIELSRKRFCRNPRGIFPNKVPGEFCGRFFGGFFGACFLGKNRRKKYPPKNPRLNPNRNLGASLPKPTLQESGLDELFKRD